MRRLVATALVLTLAAGALAAAAGADGDREYRIEMYNAFGIVNGSEVRVAGVNAGTVQSLSVNERKRAVVVVELDTGRAELGDESECSTEPQSLIAEYFIDCDTKGEPLPEGGTIPAERVSQTVQPDLVQNAMREPFRERFRLLLNEFGTALAGNPDDLNEAIRLGAPALRELSRAFGILADQNRTIRGLNVNSSQVIGELAAQRTEIRRFIDEVEDSASISASRRENVSQNFDMLDDFLAELEPSLAQMDATFGEQIPLLEDLRAAAPDLNRVARDLPRFNRATVRSLRSLGEAAEVGERALREGEEEIEILAQAGRKAPLTADALADFLSDIDDPRRAVEIDRRVPAVTGRDNPEPGQRDTMGYTGLEGLLNYVHYQALAINQFDRVSHMLHFGLYEAYTGPCGEFSSGRNPQTGAPGVPKEGGGTTTDILEAARCIAWLGPNQPGINDDIDGPAYHASVCPEGTSPDHAARRFCPGPGAEGAEASARGGRERGRGGDEDEATLALQPSTLPGAPGRVRETLEDLLGVTDGILGDDGRKGGRSGGGGRGGLSRQASDLLDFLMKP